MILKNKKIWVFKIITGGILFLFSLISPLYAETLSMVSYYPAPNGAFDRLNLVPSTLSNPCAIGSLAVDQTTSTLKYCGDNGAGSGQWGALNSTWSQVGNYVYPTETNSNPNIFIGIGTTTTSPEFKLTLDNDGGILALGTFGSGQAPADLVPDYESRLMWYPKKAAFRVGKAYDNAWDDSNIGNYSIVLGFGNIASGTASVNVGDGLWESSTAISTASGNYSTMLNSVWANTAIGDYSTALTTQGGPICDGNYCTAFGGTIQASGLYATSNYSFHCDATGTGSTCSVGDYSVGSYSTVNASRATNVGNYATISGGGGFAGHYIGNGTNGAGGHYATISGGHDHNVYFIAVGDYSTIAGGDFHLIRGQYATIAGGYDGSSTGISSIITGGASGRSVGNYSVITGGASNQSWSIYSVIAGGYSNYASGLNTVIAGGANNRNDGDYSFAAGRYMNLHSNADRTFLWGYNTATATISNPDSFIIYSGKVGIHQTDIVASDAILNILDSGSSDYLAMTRNTSSTPGDILIVKNNGWIGIGKAAPAYPIDFGTQAAGAHITAGGVWTTLSSREYKKNIKPLAFSEAEQALSKLNPVKYTYRTNQNERHIGFIAEDMPDLLAEKERKSIDPMGIAAVLTLIEQQNKNELNTTQLKMQQLEERIKAAEYTLDAHP